MAVLCMSHEGYLSLCTLLTRAYPTKEDPFRGQVDAAWFEDGGCNGLIALTGGKDGLIGQLLLAGKIDHAREALSNLKHHFGDRLYVELQRAGHHDDEVATAKSAVLAAEMDVPVVATHPIQFLKKEDFEAHEVRGSIAEGYTLADPRRSRLFTTEQYFKSSEEMCELFADIPAAIENTVEIAVQVNGKVRARLTIAADLSKEDAIAAAKAEEKIASELAGKTIVKEICVPGKLVNIVAK